jgi:predicted nucleic acid-binding Zn ribbon protein
MFECYGECGERHQCGAATSERESMSEKKTTSEEEKRNHRFSFLVGIVIALIILTLFVIFFNK